MHLTDVRDLARSLPLVTEEPHHDFGSFRVKGKIFATFPPDFLHLHVFVDDDAIDPVVAASPAVSELWWGRKRVGVRIALADADPAQVEALLRAAWARKAPKRMV